MIPGGRVAELRLDDCAPAIGDTAAIVGRTSEASQHISDHAKQTRSLIENE